MNTCAKCNIEIIGDEPRFDINYPDRKANFCPECSKPVLKAMKKISEKKFHEEVEKLIAVKENICTN
jgi:hypothetical protein